MEAKVYLTKSTFAKHLADLVELKLCLRWLIVFLEAVLDQLLDETHLLGSRA